MRMPRVSYTVKHHCVEGWSAIASWHGVPVSAIVEQCRPTKAARYISFVSFDADYSNGWDMASARSEEHTSELQSHSELVCRLLLEKKNVYVGFMVRTNFTATKCLGLVALNQVSKDLIGLQPLKGGELCSVL